MLLYHDNLFKASRRFREDVEAIVEDETAEREVRLATRDVTRIENLEKHRSDIKNRPKKSWIISNAGKDRLAREVKEDRETRMKQGAMDVNWGSVSSGLPLLMI